MEEDIEREEDSPRKSDDGPRNRQIVRIPGPLDAVDEFIPRNLFLVGNLIAFVSLILAVTTRDETRWYFLLVSVLIWGYFGTTLWRNRARLLYMMREIEHLAAELKREKT